MPIQQIGAQGNAGTTVTIPAHSNGDLLLIFAYRDGQTTAPTAPSAGGTVPTWNTIGSTGGNANSSRFAWATGTGSSTSGTWTNATEMICLVYRGARVGASVGAGAQSVTISFPALALQRTDSTSWAVGVAGHRTATNVEAAPSGMTNRVFTGAEAAGHDTNGTISSWSAQTVTVNANSGWRSWVLELRSIEYTETPTAGSYAVTGNEVTLTKGGAPKVLTADAGSYSITGQEITGQSARRIISDAGSLAIAGNAATFQISRRIIGDAGIYDLTGNNATLTEGAAPKEVHVVAGSYTQTGNDAALLWNRAAAADAGGYVVAGQSAGLLKAWATAADAGAYALSGQDAALLAARMAAAAAGAYAITGNDAGLLRARVLAAAAGEFTITGQAAELLYSGGAAQLNADAGSYALSGQSVTVLLGRIALAGAGSYSTTGAGVTMLRTRSMDAVVGSYAVTGGSVNLNKGGGQQRRQRVSIFF